MIAVRVATRNDIPRIVSLHVRNWLENNAKNISAEFMKSNDLEINRNNLWNDRLNNPNEKQFIAVAEINGEFAGFICVYMDIGEKLSNLIDILHVEPIHRLHGVATNLMHKAAEWFEERRPNAQIYLTVLAENKRARNFYQGLGGKNATEEPFLFKSADGLQRLSFHVTWENPYQLAKVTKEKILNDVRSNKNANSNSSFFKDTTKESNKTPSTKDMNILGCLRDPGQMLSKP